MDNNLDNKYNPKEIENKLYNFWEENKFFHPQVDKNKKPFCVVIPPPNVTSVLHMGHGLNNTIQDVIVRYKRMSGYNTLWVPGTDHAGIATQNVVEREIAKEGLTRHDLGREKFLKKVWEWKEKYGNAIINQLKKIGCSCDWDRTRFTMDEGLSNAVRKAFVKLYEEGLIYKDEYIINWCPRCETALSDEEVEYKEENSKLYYIKYYIVGSDDYLIVATVRPETMLGDTGVAVNPQDKRYKDFVGKKVILPLVGRHIPVIADDHVDPHFGTGVLKITPSHDKDDFEIAKRHKLPLLCVIDIKGKMNNNAGKYKNLDRFEARKKIVEDLEKESLLIKIEDYKNSVGRCYRCDTVIEPYVSPQWFVKMAPLAEKAKEVVEKDIIRLIPEQWKKVYLNWMENIKDWCISRQIWWGHRIPAWQCHDCGKYTVKLEDPNVCSYCGSKNIKQEEDVLDTWFSSWLWPLSTLGWPDETEDLSYFYPTDFLSTAPEILFFWVARMIMAGLFFRNKIPFKDVYLHSTVCDAHGRKMSKSLGNGIDPLEIVEEFGADSLRFSILYLAPIGQRIRLSKDSFEMGYKFANKIWNAARFIFLTMNSIEKFQYKNIADIKLDEWDKWILKELSELINRCNSNLEKYRFNELTNDIYHFIWDNFCDWYIEVSKTKENKNEAVSLLLYILEILLRVLHPIMPFITEEIWQKLPNKTGKTIVLSQYPKESYKIEGVTKEIETIKELIYIIRNIRGDFKIKPTEFVKVAVESDKEIREYITKNEAVIKTLAKVKEIEIKETIEKPKQSICGIGNGFKVYVLIDGDITEQIKRLEKEEKEIENKINIIKGKLSNSSFLSKAPQEVIEKDREEMEKLNERIRKIKEMKSQI
ncbi:MAG TPA: valine--tRNA ligase [Spirochaetota bacterium]|nr:valine--tRNA ligase [Spirochaetota bacterium]HOM38159.1 valine--tRNA ligase [Spirochaetota bacterium]HPQ48623.1 valine--tRNA ligase [Spirochaetota bacterium]